MTTLQKLRAGAYEVFTDREVPEPLYGIVEEFTRCPGLKQWRFRVLRKGFFYGKFVAVGNTRAEAVEEGAAFVEAATRYIKPETLETRDLYSDLLRLSGEYREALAKDDDRHYGRMSGDSWKVLGAMDYITDKLLKSGYDAKVLRAIKHDAVAEDWQHDEPEVV